MKCIIKGCGSYAINIHLHGRDNTDLDLCDVCYWRKRGDKLLKDAHAMPTASFKRYNKGGSGEVVHVTWHIPEADIPDEGALIILPRV